MQNSVCSYQRGGRKMIEYLKQQIASESTGEKKVNRLREVLQLFCLKMFHDKGYYSKMVFVGGTALRVIYDTRRFSEDLDFSVTEVKGYDFSEMISALTREFKLVGLEMASKPKTVKTVHSSMLKFPGLLKEMGLSALASQILSIKIDVDSNPPKGGRVESTLINKLYTFTIAHYDLSSLYATKLHACLFRTYTKGRDFYDLVWYLGKKIIPNYALLNNAITQTQGTHPDLGPANIKDYLLKNLETVDFAAIKKDVERFLEDKNELALLNADVISKGIVDVFGNVK